jgi:osmotically-inducible protein OsmY
VKRQIVWFSLIALLGLTVSCSNDYGTSRTEEETQPTPPAQGINPPAATDADNTARNAETGADVTTQSESEADVRITAAIRKAIVDDNSLSVNAHNVKVTTSGGSVTLRGPVKSEQEKANIEAKAKQVAGVLKVNNLLEIERNP